ncbi:hypothetical protein BGZ83_004484 [Gryganskiella cystojenkinii]|nr:hypothetical protein BGZ83_004484 [Gryganskiella cystojenkinii]
MARTPKHPDSSPHGTAQPTREPTPPSSLGPTSSPSPPPATDEPSIDATKSTISSETIKPAESTDEHTASPPRREPSAAPEDPSYSAPSFRSPTYREPAEDIYEEDDIIAAAAHPAVEPWQVESPLDRVLSPSSTEFLRRQAISPRKPKWTTKPLFNSSPMRPLTFSTPETALGSEKKTETNQSPSSSDDVFVDAVEHVVEGSDPESEADWDKDEFLSPKGIADDIIPDPVADISVDMTLAKDIALSSDDDDITLERFSNRKIPMMLEESDSDLDEDPFSSDTTPTASPAQRKSPSLPPPRRTRSSAMGLVEEDDPFGGGPLPGRSTGKTSSPTKSSATTMGVRRSARNVTVQAKPLVIDFDIPVSKAAAPTKLKKITNSLDSLLKEKTRREKVGYNLEVTQSNITFDDELDDYDEEAEENAVYAAATELPEGVLSKEQEGALNQIMQEGQDEIIYDLAEFFVHWPQPLTVSGFEADDLDAKDPVLEKLQSRSRNERDRSLFLTSPYLPILCKSAWRMPPSVFHWLVQVMAAEQNAAVTSSVFSILQRVLTQRTNILGVDHEDLTAVFRLYGAKEECLEVEWSVTPVTSETKRERNISTETAKFPVQNLKAIIKLINLTATLDPLFYDEDEIRRIISMLLRMTTDPIIGDVKSELGSALAALLGAVPQPLWEEEHRKICNETLQIFGTSLPFVLLALHQLPSLSDRMSLLRRSIAVAYLKVPPISPNQTVPDLNELHRTLFIDRGFEVGPETDYRALGQRVQVFSFCLDDDQMIAGYGRTALEPVIRKLKLMHGKIIDVRAAFMERTLTKDIIQRLYMRLYYAGIHRQIVKQTTLNFGKVSDGTMRTVDLSTLRLAPELESQH